MEWALGSSHRHNTRRSSLAGCGGLEWFDRVRRGIVNIVLLIRVKFKSEKDNNSISFKSNEAYCTNVALCQNSGNQTRHRLFVNKLNLKNMSWWEENIKCLNGTRMKNTTMDRRASIYKSKLKIRLHCYSFVSNVWCSNSGPIVNEKTIQNKCANV